MEKVDFFFFPSKGEGNLKFTEFEDKRASFTG